MGHQSMKHEAWAGMSWGSDLVIELQSAHRSTLTHLMVDEMIPTDGTLRILADHSHQLQCLVESIVLQQTKGVPRQLQGISEVLEFFLQTPRVKDHPCSKGVALMFSVERHQVRQVLRRGGLDGLGRCSKSSSMP